MASARSAGGLPGLVRLLARAADTAIIAFNLVSSNTSSPFTFNINVESEAKPLLRVLDAIANSTSQALGPYYFLAGVIDIVTVNPMNSGMREN